MEKIKLLFFLLIIFLSESYQQCNITADKVFILHADYMRPAKVMPITLCNASAVVKNQPITLDDYEHYLKIEGAFVSSENKEKLPVLYSHTFSQLPNLKTLIISMVELEILEPEAFKNLGNLKYLNLRKNNLKSLPSHIFNDVPNLKILNLEENKLESIDEHLFDKLFHLRDLYLNVNEIKVLPGHWHTGLRQLEYLNLAANQLKVLERETFHSLITLDRLRLHRNKLGEIERDAFKGLSKLNSLTLEYNQNISIHLVNELNNMPNLTGVALSPFNFKCDDYLPALDHIKENKIELVEIPFTSKCGKSV